MSKRYIVSTEIGYYATYSRFDVALRKATVASYAFKNVKVYDTKLKKYSVQILEGATSHI